MAINSYLGKILTNRYAPNGTMGAPVTNDSYYADGEFTGDMDFVSSVAADSIGSTYKLLTVPSNCRLHSLQMYNDAQGASAACSVGVYYPQFLPSNIPLSGTAVNAAFFASGYSAASASTGWVDILNQSGSNTIAKQQQNLWQALGLTADPICEFDIVITLSGAAVSTGGTFALKSEEMI